MTNNLVARLDIKYKQYGVRAQVLMPGFVDTKFSNNIRGNSPALLPEEVANCISNMLLTSGSNVEILDIGINKSGDIKFIDKNKNLDKKYKNANKTEHSPINKDLNIKSEISSIIMNELELKDISDLDNGALGYTVGWDSLNHIKIILAVENYFSIKFSSENFENLTSLDDIVNSVETILINKNS